ncbi:MAG: PilT/PilU family type 4a pilus ATPase [Verrucomicrobiota bacterium]
MDTSRYNDYVLEASLQAQWIDQGTVERIQTALTRLPGVAALDFMVDQQILGEEQATSLRTAIEEAETSVSEPTAAGSAVVKETQIQFSGEEATQVLDYLRYAVQVGASDLHIGPDSQALVRYQGHLVPVDESSARLTPEQTERLGRQFLTPEQQKQVEEIGSIDFCYDAGEGARFRASVVRQRRGWESVFRIINADVKTMEELGFPDVMYDLLKYHNGIVLVTGSVSSGKTTTLAAMVDQLNKERSDHIITLEDPIEYVHESIQCQMTQREIHSHTESFATALRASLRQDPDIIMVGEMRDLETISLAITAAETGHLVLATLHTSNAARTMQRLLDVFPIEQQAQIRTMVSESMRGIICQQLVPRKDGNGRALALEIMVNTPAIGNLIREGKNVMIPGQMQTGKKQGMRLMDDSLMELIQQDIITPEEGLYRAENKKLFGAALAGNL